MNIQIKKILTFFSILCAVVILTSCTTTCHEVKISHAEQDMWHADVLFRQCGSASGYSVAIYTDDEGEPGNGEGNKEIFKTLYTLGYDTRDIGKETSPVDVEWKADNHLMIHHKTRMTMEDDKGKPMVTKADTTYRNINIEYDPRPVFWNY